MDQSNHPEGRIARERGLFKRLLEIAQAADVGEAIRDVLAEAVRLTGADIGYIELGRCDEDGAARWWTAHGVTGDEVDVLRQRVSRGIIREARESGEIIRTNSAILDADFNGRDSVRVHGIEAVVARPLGRRGELGVLYLQRHQRTGGFRNEDVELLEIMAASLPEAVRRLLERELQGNADPTANWRELLAVDDLVGRSAALAEVFRHVALAAHYSTPVLILGESGVGKTAVARAIHESGPRRPQPFVAFGCGGLTATSVHATIFGVEENAFTGVRGKPGLVDNAEGGTLFFDEIDSLDPVMQRALLDLVEEGTYVRYGGTKPRRCSARIVVATNADLDGMARSGAFRRDLLYRLDVIRIEVPPLSARADDIPAIAARLCARVCASQSIPKKTLSMGATLSLRSREWPGNIRDLRNAITRAVLNAELEGVSVIGERHLTDPGTAVASEGASPLTLEEAERSFRRTYLLRVLDEEDWNVTQAAKRAGIARSTINKYMVELNITRAREADT